MCQGADPLAQGVSSREMTSRLPSLVSVSYTHLDVYKRQVDPSIDEETRLATSKRIDTAITEQGGKVSNVEDWGKRKLAYEINGLAEGDYTLIDFEADPTAIAELDRVLHIMDAVQRYMITRRNGETTSVESA